MGRTYRAVSIVLGAGRCEGEVDTGRLPPPSGRAWRGGHRESGHSPVEPSVMPLRGYMHYAIQSLVEGDSRVVAGRSVLLCFMEPLVFQSAIGLVKGRKRGVCF